MDLSTQGDRKLLREQRDIIREASTRSDKKLAREQRDAIKKRLNEAFEYAVINTPIAMQHFRDVFTASGLRNRVDIVNGILKMDVDDSLTMEIKLIPTIYSVYLVDDSSSMDPHLFRIENKLGLTVGDVLNGIINYYREPMEIVEKYKSSLILRQHGYIEVTLGDLMSLDIERREGVGNYRSLSDILPYEKSRRGNFICHTQVNSALVYYLVLNS